MPDVDAIVERLKAVHPGMGDRSAIGRSAGRMPTALVIGGGYIGLEAAGANAALDLAGAPDDDPRRLRMPGVLGTAVVRAEHIVAAVTGITEARATREEVPCAVMYIPVKSHAGYYPGAKPILMKFLYDPETGRPGGRPASSGPRQVVQEARPGDGCAIARRCNTP